MMEVVQFVFNKPLLANIQPTLCVPSLFGHPYKVFDDVRPKKSVRRIDLELPEGTHLRDWISTLCTTYTDEVYHAGGLTPALALRFLHRLVANGTTRGAGMIDDQRQSEGDTTLTLYGSPTAFRKTFGFGTRWFAGATSQTVFLLDANLGDIFPEPPVPGMELSTVKCMPGAMLPLKLAFALAVGMSAGGWTVAPIKWWLHQCSANLAGRAVQGQLLLPDISDNMITKGINGGGVWSKASSVSTWRGARPEDATVARTIGTPPQRPRVILCSRQGCYNVGAKSCHLCAVVFCSLACGHKLHPRDDRGKNAHCQRAARCYGGTAAHFIKVWSTTNAVVAAIGGQNLVRTLLPQLFDSYCTTTPETLRNVSGRSKTRVVCPVPEGMSVTRWFLRSAQTFGKERNGEANRVGILTSHVAMSIFKACVTQATGPQEFDVDPEVVAGSLVRLAVTRCDASRELMHIFESPGWGRMPCLWLFPMTSPAEWRAALEPYFSGEGRRFAMTSPQVVVSDRYTRARLGNVVNINLRCTGELPNVLAAGFSASTGWNIRSLRSWRGILVDEIVKRGNDLAITSGDVAQALYKRWRVAMATGVGIPNLYRSIAIGVNERFYRDAPVSTEATCSPGAAAPTPRLEGITITSVATIDHLTYAHDLGAYLDKTRSGTPATKSLAKGRGEIPAGVLNALRTFEAAANQRKVGGEDGMTVADQLAIMSIIEMINSKGYRRTPEEEGDDDDDDDERKSPHPRSYPGAGAGALPPSQGDA